MKVRVSAAKCNGYGLCAETCPEVFQLDEWGQAYVVKDYEEGVPEALQERALAAVDVCPESAITVEDGQ